MLAKLRSRLSYANVMATVAVFIALGGGSYAAIKLPANSVGTEQLKKNAVTLKKIKRSTRAALKGRKGDTGPRGATGATGLNGQRGPAGPGAIKLDWSGTAQPATTTQLFSTDGLSITAICQPDNASYDLFLNFGAPGPNATANATWTDLNSNFPNDPDVHQDGVANGTLSVNIPVGFNPPEFRRGEGQAVLRNDTLVISVAFHAFITGSGSCKVDGTVTPAA